MAQEARARRSGGSVDVLGFSEAPTRHDLSAAALERYPSNAPSEVIETDEE
jgi:hypothetical protein